MLVNVMLESIDPSAHVALYPSSCRYSDDFQTLPFDVVILNDIGHRREQQIGKVFYLPYDNNQLLGMLVRLGIRISTIVIIRDGCIEGGNYECVTRDGFIGRLWPVLTEEFEIHCDHGNLPPDVPALFESIDTPSYLQAFLDNSDPINTVKSYRGNKCLQSEHQLQVGDTQIRLFWDSLWSHVNDPGLKVVRTGGSAEKAVQNYLNGLQIADVECDFIFVNQTSQLDVVDLLGRAKNLGVSCISFMPIGANSYPRILRALREQPHNNPRQLRFYHLNATDFRYFKKLDNVNL